jgi:hypothetical protein
LQFSPLETTPAASREQRDFPAGVDDRLNGEKQSIYLASHLVALKSIFF